MKRQRTERPLPRRAWRPWALGTIVVIAVGTAVFVWSLGAPGGRPRLVVDREVIELGDLRFAAPAKAVFTLTNAGNGRLEIAEELRVEVVKGC